MKFFFHQIWTTSIFFSNTWNLYHLHGNILILAFSFSLVHFLVLECSPQNRIVAQLFSYFVSNFWWNLYFSLPQNIIRPTWVSRNLWYNLFPFMKTKPGVIKQYRWFHKYRQFSGVIIQTYERSHKVLQKYCGRTTKTGEKRNYCCIPVFKNAKKKK